jgi:hypothetical protein
MSADFVHYRGRALFWVWALVILVVAWLFGRGSLSIGAGDSTVGGAKAWVTSEFATAHMLGIGTLLFHGFFAAIVCGLPIFRDEEVRIGGLLRTTPLTRREYVWAKFSAALVACVAMLALHLVLAIVFNHVVPTSKPEIRGPLTVGSYVRPFVVLALPTVVFVSGAAFAIGTRSLRPVMVFVLPVAILLACAFVLWTWSPVGLDPRTNQLLMLLDPTGFRWLRESYLDVDRGVAFYNQVPIVWGPALISSRIAWAGVGLAAVALVARRSPADRTSRPRSALARGLEPDLHAERVRAISHLEMRRVVPPAVRSIWMLARFELRGLARQAGLYLFVPVILLSVLPAALSETGPFDSALLPTPGRLANQCWSSLITCTTLLLLFYTVESLERDAGARLLPLVDASPLSPAALVLGRVLANVILGALIMVVAWLACLAIMIVHRTPSKSPLPFLLLWGACGLPTIVAWATFVAMIWAKARNRYVTYGFGLLVMMGTGWLFVADKTNWLTNWTLWQSLMWSDISVLEADRAILVANRSFVLAVGVRCGRLAVSFYRKRETDRVTTPPVSARSISRRVVQLSPYWLPAVGLGLGVWGCMESGHQSERAKKEAKNYWKQNVATFADAPTPDLTFVDLDVDLEPAEGRATIRGTYTLENRSPTPMRHVLLTIGRNLRAPSFTMNGDPWVPEDRSGLLVFTPGSPLRPAERMTIGFSYTAHVPDGPSARGGRLAEFILPSGVALTSFSPSFVPVVGFREGIGVDEDNAANERVYEPDFHEGPTRPALAGAGAPFRTKIRITTPDDFTANSVGIKTEDLVRDGRRTVSWESDQPVHFFNIVAGRWVKYEAADTEIYYDPRHGLNVAELSLALQSAKKHYSEWFHPFPWKTLKLSEFPGLVHMAQGFPTNITFSESLGFLADPRGDDHLPFWIAAHEAAHQWWPNLVIPGEGPGAPVLSEGLSHFSAMLLLEAVKGEAARMDFAKRLEHRYGKSRVADAEQPLVRVDSTGNRKGLETVWYDRGGWAFWMLMETMGRQEIFAGLHAYVEKYRGNPDHPTLHDLFVTLRPHARDPKAFDDCVAQWFAAVTLPRFEVAAITKEPVGSGMRIAGRLRNAGTGDLSVDVAVVAGERFGSAGYREARTRVSVGPARDAEFSIETDFAPANLVVDPDVKILQLGRKGATIRL